MPSPVRGFTLISVLSVSLLASGCAGWVERVNASLQPSTNDAASTMTSAATRPISLVPERVKALPQADIGALMDIVPVVSRQDTMAPAAAMVDELGQEVLAVLENPALDDDDRVAYMRGLLADHLDISLIGRIVLGNHWRGAGPAQRDAYLNAFETFLLDSYAHQLGHVSIDRFTVTKARSTGKRDFLVESKLHRDGGNATMIWRLRPHGTGFRILDITIEGVSMVLTRRQEFASVLRADNGGLDGLIDELRQKRF